MKLEEAERIFNEQVKSIRPPEEILRKINKLIDEYCALINEKLKNKNIKAEVFIGGSLAKGTLFKKGVYDIDIFVRFDGYKSDEISKLLKKILGKRFKRVHGSRDYFHLEKDNILLEIIPVLKIYKPEEAKNVTDLSYFHVNYVVDKIKNNERLKDEIILAKNFCFAQNVYGAESYIKGFSGYALELLICHYKSLLNLIQEVVKLKDGEKLIIDDARLYTNKEEILRNLNVAKRQSPIILIDPTFKERNALSSLSEETFSQFKKACEQFLKNPSKHFFDLKSISDKFERLKNVKIISIKTDKQVGDIAGTKSKKFNRFFLRQLEKDFNIKKNGFDYKEESNKAYFYFILGKKKNDLIRGPKKDDKKNVERFRKAHRNAFVQGDFVYAPHIHSLSFDDWLRAFKRKNKKVMHEMGITYLRKK